jgi:type VI secretion system protein ImpJ
MLKTKKPLWGEGLFLRPQHFQRQDAYHEGRLAEVLAMVQPFFWGCKRVVIDTDALASGVLRVEALQLVLPDGDLLNAPRDDVLPAPLSLQQLGPDVAEVVVHVAVAPLRTHGGNVNEQADVPDLGVRYQALSEDAEDWFTHASDGEVVGLQKTCRLVTDREPMDHLVTVPLCRLRRNSTSGFELDARFIVPCVSLESSAPLRAMLRRLQDALQAKVNALYGFHRQPSQHVIEFRSGDVASFWLLHTASSAYAGLTHLHHHPGLHPERLFQSMLQLAGALMTFSKSFTLTDLPIYRHDKPDAAFHRLEEIVMGLLETVISTKYFSIALREAKPSYHAGVLESEKISASTTLVLGVRSSMPASELVEVIPVRCKVGAGDDVEKLVLSAMAGIRLQHLPQVPGAIPVRPGCLYFELDAKSALYERMLKSQSISLYVPAGIPDIELELFALNNG